MCRVVPGNAGDEAARPGAGAAQVEALDRRAVVGHPGYRSHAEPAAERHVAVQLVALEQPELVLEIEGAEAAYVGDDLGQVGDEPGQDLDASRAEPVTDLRPRSFGQMVGGVPEVDAHDVLAGRREPGTGHRRDEPPHERLVRWPAMPPRAA